MTVIIFKRHGARSCWRKKARVDTTSLSNQEKLDWTIEIGGRSLENAASKWRVAYTFGKKVKKEERQKLIWQGLNE